MGNYWLKFKFWSKVSVFSLLILYVLLFFIKNADEQVQFWFWFGHEPKTTVLPLVLWAFGTGVIGTLLVRTTFNTIRQYQTIRDRGRSERMRRDVDDMKAKAAMLRPRQGESPAPGGPGDLPPR